MVRAAVPKEKLLVQVTTLSAIVDPKINAPPVGRNRAVVPQIGVPVNPVTERAPPYAAKPPPAAPNWTWLAVVPKARLKVPLVASTPPLSVRFPVGITPAPLSA